MAFFSRAFARCTNQHLHSFRQSAFTSNQPSSQAFSRPSIQTFNRFTTRFSPTFRQTRGYRFAGNERPKHVPSHQSRNVYKTSRNIINGIIGINVAVYGIANFAPDQFRGLKQAINDNSILNMHAIQQSKYWTLITSAFAHGNLFHLLGNMVSLYAFGGFLASHPGILPSHIITLLIGSALTCSIASLVNANNKGASPYFSFIGASGVVMGLGAAGAVLNPRARFLIYGVFPAPIWLLLGAFALYDVYYLDDAGSRIGHAGHLGGLSFGLIFALTRLRALRYPL